MMRWIEGRQGGAYSKLKLFQLSFMDCWLIKYAPNYSMPKHKDSVEGKKHFRLNIELSGKGKFICEKTIVNIFNKIILFRPDLYEHSMVNGTKLDRISDFGSEGWGFESSLGHSFKSLHIV